MYLNVRSAIRTFHMSRPGSALGTTRAFEAARPTQRRGGGGTAGRHVALHARTSPAGVLALARRFRARLSLRRVTRGEGPHASRAAASYAAALRNPAAAPHAPRLASDVNTRGLRGVTDHCYVRR